MLFERHEQRVIKKPPGVFLSKRGNFLLQGRKAPGVGAVQKRVALRINCAVIYALRVFAPCAGDDLLFCKQPIRNQQVKVNKIRVSGVHGEGLIGRIPVAGMAHGQHLPVALLGFT